MEICFFYFNFRAVGLVHHSCIVNKQICNIQQLVRLEVIGPAHEIKEICRLHIERHNDYISGT
jgi:hypothetical protein